jgi:hypothetical protein
LKKFLEDEGCWFVKFFANAYTKSGVPDILCCCNGYFVAVEGKAPNGRPSELQKYNIRKINSGSHGFGVILYPNDFDDFKTMIAFLKDDCSYSASIIRYRINERWDK